MSAIQHNELARKFVYEVVKETKTHSQMMVVMESAILAAMISLQTIHGFKKPDAAAMIEMAVQRAIERFVEYEKKMP